LGSREDKSSRNFCGKKGGLVTLSVWGDLRKEKGEICERIIIDQCLKYGEKEKENAVELLLGKKEITHTEGKNQNYCNN